MSALGLILIVAALGCAVSRFTGMPLVPLYLIGGWLLGASGIHGTEEIATEALQLGVAVLVFLAGAELNPQRLRSGTRRILILTLLPMAATAGAVFLWARFHEVATPAAIDIACALAGSSTIVALRQLRRLSQTLEPFGRLVTAIQIVQDFLLIGVLVVLHAFPGGWNAVPSIIGGTLLLLGAAQILQSTIIPWVVATLRPGEETLLMLMLAMLFSLVGASSFFGLPLVVGAFAAGISISRFPTSGLLRVQIAALGDFFTALFFVVLGYFADIPDISQWPLAVGLIAIIVIGRPLITAILARRCGLTARPAIECGLLTGQAGEIGLVIALAALGAGHIEAETFGLVALVTAISMMPTPFLATERVTSWILHTLPIRRRTKAHLRTRGHVIMLGFGAAGRWVLKELSDAGHTVVVVDDDPAIVSQLEEMNVRCVLGCGSEKHVLDAAGAHHAKAILCSMRRVTDAESVLRLVHGIPILARVFEASDAERVRTLGGIPVMNSLASAQRFINWLDSGTDSSHKENPAPTTVT
jgi:Kef-type K+ transport system membrane component KefB